MSAIQPVTTYDHSLYGTAKPWRGIVAILILFVSMIVLSLLFGAIAIAIEVHNGTMSFDDPDSLVAITPLVLLSTNIALGALIPISILLQRWLFGVRAGTLFSVVGRLRWRWLDRLALVFVPVYAIYIGGSFLLGTEAELQLGSVALALVAVAVLTTPFQAAAEEVGFRGLVQRAVGSWFRNPRIALVVSTAVSALVFGLAHFATDWWLITYYVLFGVAASIATRLTGGLESFIVVHAANNVLTFSFAAVYGGLGEGIDRSEGAGSPLMLIPILLAFAAAFLSGWMAKRFALATTAPRPLTVKEEQEQAST